MVAEHVLYYLRERGCPQKNSFLFVADYLRGCTVGLAGKHGTVKKNATKGCLQGSILGPSLWNLVFDDLLHTLGQRGVRAVTSLSNNSWKVAPKSKLRD